MQMTSSVPPHALRYDITGCHLAAIVLERLQYWTPKARRRVKGAVWIAKSREELMAETRLTDKQLRTALEKLKVRELVETTQLIFGGKNVMHIRLTPRGIYAMRSAGLKLGVLDEEDALQGGLEMAPTGGLEMALEGQLIIQGDTTGGYTQGDCNSYGVTTTPDFSEKVPEEIKTMKEPRKPRVHPKAPLAEKPKPQNSSEVMDMLKAGKRPAPKPGKPVPLGAVWQEAMVKFYPGEFHHALTIKDQGQLKLAASKLSPGEAPKIIRAVISNWGYFTDKAAAEAKAFDVPTKPHPGFFLRYVAVAANFKAKSTASEGAVAVTVEPPSGGWAKKGAQIIAQTPAAPKAKKLSPEEALALMNELEKDG